MFYKNLIMIVLEFTLIRLTRDYSQLQQKSQKVKIKSNLIQVKFKYINIDTYFKDW